jgi:hypothetical protein
MDTVLEVLEALNESRELRVQGLEPEVWLLTLSQNRRQVIGFEANAPRPLRKPSNQRNPVLRETEARNRLA